tara:strand:+ start:12151 stop:12594 length:444 start_codon:yes stop_codon:yes gene_type:complete
MALFKFQNLNKHGNLRTRIVHSPTSQFSFKPKGFGKFVNVQRFYYEMEHAYLSAALWINNEGDKILLPTMQKVHPKTTLDDIKVIRPKPKKRTEPIIETNISSSGEVTYETKYYPDSGNYYCSCPGTWRAKDRRCKHIKALELKNKK